MRVNPHVSRQVRTSWKTARPQGPRLGQAVKTQLCRGATHRRSGVLPLQGDALLSICWKIRLHEQQGSCQAAGRQSCRWVPSRQHTLPQPEVGTAAPEPDIELLSVGACACALRAPRRHAPMTNSGGEHARAKAAANSKVESCWAALAKMSPIPAVYRSVYM